MVTFSESMKELQNGTPVRVSAEGTASGEADALRLATDLSRTMTKLLDTSPWANSALWYDFDFVDMVRGSFGEPTFTRFRMKAPFRNARKGIDAVISLAFESHVDPSLLPEDEISFEEARNFVFGNKAIASAESPGKTSTGTDRGSLIIGASFTDGPSFFDPIDANFFGNERGRINDVYSPFSHHIEGEFAAEERIGIGALATMKVWVDELEPLQRPYNVK